jgi:hypothetical protein
MIRHEIVYPNENVDRLENPLDPTLTGTWSRTVVVFNPCSLAKSTGYKPVPPGFSKVSIHVPKKIPRKNAQRRALYGETVLSLSTVLFHK